MRLRTATVLVAAAALLASGCSDDSKPQVLPSLAPTATATPTPVAIPSAATPATAQGAAEFVKFYFAMLDSSYQRGVAFPLKTLSSSECKSCSNFAGIADKLVMHGTHLTGPTFANVDVQAPPLQAGSSSVAFICDLPARDEADASGKVLAKHPAQPRLRLTVTATRWGSGWIIKSMATV